MKDIDMKLTPEQIKGMKEIKGTAIFYILHDERRCSVCGEVGSVKHFSVLPGVYRKECEKCGAQFG